MNTTTQEQGNIQPVRLGFIGFGEAAYHLAKGLRGAGVSVISAYDIHSGTPGRRELIQRRAAESGVPLLSSSAVLAKTCDIVFSTVTADQALCAAQTMAPHLTLEHLYADLNSVSPTVKISIGETIETSGAGFVEVAVMSAVPPHGHRVPMLAGGKSAARFERCLSTFGMKIEVCSSQVGEAAATKMCRSIVIKGIEALITECVLGATWYGADERVLLSLGESFPGIDWQKLATYFVSRVAVHGERRAREMEEVVETLRAAGVDPIMSEATARRMDWSAARGFNKKFGSAGPASYQEFAREAREPSMPATKAVRESTPA